MLSQMFFNAGFAVALLAGTNVYAADKDDVCARTIQEAGKGLSSQEAIEVRRGMVQFGLDLHRELAQTTGKSTVTSPFSVMSMLSMLRVGASGDTGSEMQRAMGTQNLSSTQFQKGMGEVNGLLRNVGQGAILAYGNLVVVDQNYRLAPRYGKILDQTYGAATWSRDFHSGGLIDEMNEYISGQTRKMIPKLLGDDDAPDAWALINAGYFKANWNVKFKVDRTIEKYAFQLADGKTAEKPMMFHRGIRLPYYSGNGFQLVSIPYEDAEFTMDILVPTVADRETPGAALSRVAKLLTEKNYSDWLSKLRVEELDVLGLPRWEVKTTLRGEIKTALQKRMPRVMSANAELTEMFENGTAPKLGQVVHACVVKTNELGSEGAFVTYGGGLERVSMNPAVTADHPFIAIIRHVKSGVPLFVITELDPQAMPRPDDKTIAAADKPVGGVELDVLISEPGEPELLVSDPSEAVRLETAVTAFSSISRNMQVVDAYLRTFGLPRRNAIVVDPSDSKESQIRQILMHLKANGHADKFLAPLKRNRATFSEGTYEAIEDYFH